jgi:putative MATE family efflux protein
MSNPLALAGQSAANQVFTSLFWLISFLPSVLTPVIAKCYAEGKDDEANDVLAQVVIMATLMGVVGTAFLVLFADKALSTVLAANSPAREFAKPYLRIRAISFLPSMLSLVGFASFRAKSDTLTPLYIATFSNLFHIALDPITIFRIGWGVAGAAAATVVSEFVSCATYLRLLVKNNMLALSKLRAPKFDTMRPLLAGGMAVQIRSIAMNVVFLSVTRATQSLDETGVAAAAHSIAIQIFNIGGIFLLAICNVAAFLVPTTIAKEGELGGKRIANRLMGWGLVLGSLLGAAQLLAISFISVFSPLEEVQKAARGPSIVASVLQIINGLVFIGEGVMQGCGDFAGLALSNVLAAGGMLWAMNILVAKYGLNGVWYSFCVFNGLRLVGVASHQFYFSRLSKRKLRKKYFN